MSRPNMEAAMREISRLTQMVDLADREGRDMTLEELKRPVSKEDLNSIRRQNRDLEDSI